MKNNRKKIISKIKETSKKENTIDNFKKNKKTPKQKIKRKVEKEIRNQKNDKEIKKLKNKKPINFKKINKKNTKNVEPLGSISRKKRMKWEMIVAMLILVTLAGRLFYIQFIQGEELKTRAYVQQTLDRSINPKRGTIYDATRKNNFSSKLYS